MDDRKPVKRFKKHSTITKKTRKDVDVRNDEILAVSDPTSTLNNLF